MRTLSQRTRRIILIFVLLALCALGALFYAGSLIASERLCIARTGVAPSERLLTDPQAFAAFAEDVRTKALVSMMRQFDEETGLFVYAENPNGAVSAADNDIRQLLASRILALESVRDEAPDPSPHGTFARKWFGLGSGFSSEVRVGEFAPEVIVAHHERNLERIMSEWYREENGRGYVFVDEKSKLGANAMLLRVLVASPHFEQYEAEAAALVRGIEALVGADGSFTTPWYREPSYEYDADYLLTFYSGEALLALLEYAEKTDDARVFSLASRVQDFYIDRYVTNMAGNYYPAYVPWHTQSLALLYEETGEQRYADAIFVLNDKVLELQDTEEFVGRFYNPATPEFGSPHGSSDAVYTEGLAYAYEAAMLSGDKERGARYARALVLGVHNLSRLQYEPRFWIPDDGEAASRLRGGIMTHACNRDIRIDTTAHAIDALTKITALWSAK